MRQSASCFGQGAVPVAVRASLSADLNPKTQTSDWEAVFVGSFPNFAVTSGKFLYESSPWVRNRCTPHQPHLAFAGRSLDFDDLGNLSFL